jgi:ADP-ribose pyrophosphatase
MAGDSQRVNLSAIKPEPGWAPLGSDDKFRSPHMQLCVEKWRTPTRPGGCEWNVVHRKAAAVVAPLTPDGKFVLVRQERVPIRATIWEFPAGQIDEATEHDDALIRATALRELREEAGRELATDGELLPLGVFFSSAGFTDEHAHLFLARPVLSHVGGLSPDEHEAITATGEFSPEELRAMIASGEIRDANTLSTFARLAALGLA